MLALAGGPAGVGVGSGSGVGGMGVGGVVGVAVGGGGVTDGRGWKGVRVGARVCGTGRLGLGGRAACRIPGRARMHSPTKTAAIPAIPTRKTPMTCPTPSFPGFMLPHGAGWMDSSTAVDETTKSMKIGSPNGLPAGSYACQALRYESGSMGAWKVMRMTARVPLRAG